MEYHLTKGAWEVNGNLSCKANSASWPRWEKPGKADIEAWQEILHAVFVQTLREDIQSSN